MDSGDRDQALKSLQKALDIDPDNDDIREEIQTIEREKAAMQAFKRTRSLRAHPASETPPDAASGGFVDECFRRSKDALDAGDEIRALQELERARRQDSANEEITRRIRIVKRSIKANNLADIGLTKLRGGDAAAAVGQACRIFEFWPQAPALEKLVSEIEKLEPAQGVRVDDLDLDLIEEVAAPEAPAAAAPGRAADAEIAAIRDRIGRNEFEDALREARAALSKHPGDSTLVELVERLEKVIGPAAGREPEPVVTTAPREKAQRERPVKEKPAREKPQREKPVKEKPAPAAPAPEPVRARPEPVRPAEERRAPSKPSAAVPAEAGRERRKLSPVLVAVVLVVLVGAAFGISRVLSPGTGGGEEQPVPVDQPYVVSLAVSGTDDFSATLDGSPVARDASGGIVLQGTDYGTRTLEIRAQGFEVYSRQIEFASGASMADTVSLSPLGTGTASLTFSFLMPAGEPQPAPGEAAILVDGERIEGLSTELLTGVHVFQAEMEGYNSLPETVLVEVPGALEQPLALLSQETSQISLTLAGDVEGNATFFVDGVQVGTGRRVTHIAERGQRTILVRLPEHEDWSRTITLGADGFSQTVSPTPLVTTGRLLIGPEPWAEVTINGQSYGQTPLPPIELEPGTYSVTLTNPDYEDQSSSVTISQGQDTMIRYTAPERQTQPDVIEEQPVIPPFAISQVAPLIPGLAAQRGDVHGYVTLEVRVLTDGTVGDVTVVSDPLGLGCGQAAVDAVRQWRFQPATQGGVPVEVSSQIQVRFDVD
jgi:protein TonB